LALVAVLARLKGMYLGQQFLALGSKPLKGIVVRVVHIKPTITLSTVLPPDPD
jgi:hypothetical protein